MTDLRIIPVPVTEEKWSPPSVEDWVREAEHKRAAKSALEARVRRLEILSVASTIVFILVHLISRL